MPFGRSGERRERVESNNQVPLEGTFEFEIVDVFFYNIVEETRVSQRTGAEYTKRKYTADLTDNQDCQLKLRLVKRPDIVVEDTIKVYTGGKSKFYKTMSVFIEVEPDDEFEQYLMAGKATLDVKATSKLLRDDLCGRHVLCTMELKGEYTRVKGYTEIPEPGDDDGLAKIPLQSNPGLQKKPLTAAQQASEQHDAPSWDDLNDEIPF